MFSRLCIAVQHAVQQRHVGGYHRLAVHYLAYDAAKTVFSHNIYVLQICLCRHRVRYYGPIVGELILKSNSKKLISLTIAQSLH